MLFSDGTLTIEYDEFDRQSSTSKKFSRNSKKQLETNYYIVENETKAVLHGTLTIEFDGFAQSITLKLSSTKCTQPQAILNTSQNLNVISRSWHSS